MTALAQVVVLALLLAAGASWCRWVWESYRPIAAPQRLSPIFIHGVPPEEAKALADAIAVGIVGRIAEHMRVVAFINSAAASAPDGAGDFRALTRVSQPLPELIQAARASAPLDVSIEFAGSKVETKGLLGFFSSLSEEGRGDLSISLLIEQKDGQFEGLASSSFAPNNAYGFALPVQGKTADVAEHIAMRFVQAHYAVDDSFYLALEPTDFEHLWRARRRAAEIALRSSGGRNAGGDDPIETEAQVAYKEILPIVDRYTRRTELQKLGAYLASISEDFDKARKHLERVKEVTGDASEKDQLDKMIAALATDAEARRETALATTTDEPPEPTTGVSALESRLLSESALVETGLPALAETVRRKAAARPVTVALVLGAGNSFPPFGVRVGPLDPALDVVADELASHTQSVAAVIATLAPKAQVRLVKALSGGMGSKASIYEAIERATAARPEILVLPIGPFDSSDQRVLQAAAQSALVIVAAGNGSQPVESLSGSSPVLYVGALDGTTVSPYSNYGAGVSLFAPGSLLTFDASGKTQRVNGTSYSAAIVAAAAANLAALSPAADSPSALRAKLLLTSADFPEGKRLQVLADESVYATVNAQPHP
jgi:hypothetical protein